MKNLQELRRKAAEIVASTEHKGTTADTRKVLSLGVTNGSTNCSSGNCGSSNCGIHP